MEEKAILGGDCDIELVVPSLNEAATYPTLRPNPPTSSRNRRSERTFATTRTATCRSVLLAF
jgi:hypothetical protein